MDSLDDTDYAIIEIEESGTYIDDHDLMITIEINYSNKTRNYQKLQSYYAPVGRTYLVDHLDKTRRCDITQFLDESLLDDYLEVTYANTVESFVITHGLLLRVLENNKKIFNPLLKKDTFKLEMEILKYSTRNAESIANVKQYHVDRLTDHMSRLDKFLV